MKYATIQKLTGGSPNHLKPDLQHPDNPLPILKDQKEPHIGGGGGQTRPPAKEQGGGGNRTPPRGGGVFPPPPPPPPPLEGGVGARGSLRNTTRGERDETGTFVSAY